MKNLLITQTSLGGFVSPQAVTEVLALRGREEECGRLGLWPGALCGTGSDPWRQRPSPHERAINQLSRAGAACLGCFLWKMGQVLYKQDGPKHHLYLSHTSFPTCECPLWWWLPGQLGGRGTMVQIYSLNSKGLKPLGHVSGSCPREPTWVTQLKLNILTLQFPGGLCFSQEDFGIVRIIIEIPSEPPESLQRQAGATNVLFSDCGCWLVNPQRAFMGNGEERDTGMPFVWGFTWKHVAVWPF